MQRYKIRITVDEDFEIEAQDEETAIEEAWDEIFNTGSYFLTVEEVEDVK